MENSNKRIICMVLVHVVWLHFLYRHCNAILALASI